MQHGLKAARDSISLADASSLPHKGSRPATRARAHGLHSCCICNVCVCGQHARARSYLQQGLDLSKGWLGNICGCPGSSLEVRRGSAGSVVQVWTGPVICLHPNDCSGVMHSTRGCRLRAAAGMKQCCGKATACAYLLGILRADLQVVDASLCQSASSLQILVLFFNTPWLLMARSVVKQQVADA